MRKQYHFRPSPNGYFAWDVDRLVELTKGFEIIEVDVESIKELDENYWFSNNKKPTCREVIHHARLIREADLEYPVILSADGRMMDGMHRVGKALLEGKKTVKAVRFEETPGPDYVDVNPDELPY